MEEAGAVRVLHVDDGDVGVPLGQDAFRFTDVAGSANREQAVIQRQLDEIHDKWLVVEHECAT